MNSVLTLSDIHPENDESDMSQTTKENLIFIDPNDLIIVGLDNEVDDENKHLLDESSNDKPVPDDMVKNITRLGVLEPVLVEEDGDTYVVIAGRKRTRAVRSANADKKKKDKKILVPCRVMPGSSKLLVAMMVAENHIREEQSLLEKSDAVIALMARGYSAAEIAEFFEVSVQTIGNWKSLAGLHSKIRDDVQSGTLSAHAAIQLASAGTKKQQLEMYNKAQEVTGDNAVTATTVTGIKDSTKTPGRTPSTAPTKGTLKRLLKACDEEEIELTEEVYDFLRWIVGDVTPRKIAGLTENLRAIEPKKKDPKKKSKKDNE